jgi:hypothetical protein
VSVVVDRHEGEEVGRRQLLAVRQLRRGLECVTEHDRSTKWLSMAITAKSAVSELMELVEALDRRVPQVERAGEPAIARDAAALKERALKRIEELEREQRRGDGV